MDGVTYAKNALQQSFGLVNMCIDGMSEEQFNFKPAGTANPASKTVVHFATGYDFFVLQTLKGDQPHWTAFAAANGLPANPTEIWGFDGVVPMEPVKEFVKKVQAAMLDYVGSLKDADLDRQVETQFFGKQTVAFVLQLMGMHAVGHAGDVAAVKGFQGLKGLPF